MVQELFSVPKHENMREWCSVVNGAVSQPDLNTVPSTIVWWV